MEENIKRGLTTWSQRSERVSDQFCLLLSHLPLVSFSSIAIPLFFHGCLSVLEISFYPSFDRSKESQMTYRSERIFDVYSSLDSNDVARFKYNTRNAIHRGRGIVICDGLKVTYSYERHEYNPCRGESSVQR